MGDRWLHPGNVERGVNAAHGGGESQPDGRGADDVGDSKGPHVPGRKLTCPSPNGNVLS